MITTVSIEYNEQVIHRWVKINFQQLKYTISNHFFASIQCFIFIFQENIEIILVICTQKNLLSLQFSYQWQQFAAHLFNGVERRKKARQKDRKIGFYFYGCWAKCPYESRCFLIKGRVSLSRNCIEIFEMYLHQRCSW